MSRGWRTGMAAQHLAAAASRPLLQVEPPGRRAAGPPGGMARWRVIMSTAPIQLRIANITHLVRTNPPGQLYVCGAPAVPGAASMSMVGTGAAAWLNQRSAVAPGSAVAPDRGAPDSRTATSSGRRGNAGAGAAVGSAEFCLPPVSPSPASVRLGGNLRRVFMVSGRILPSSAGARRSAAAGVSDGSRRRDSAGRRGRRLPGFPTGVVAEVGGWPGRVVGRLMPSVPTGELSGAGRQMRFSGRESQLNSSNHNCRAFLRRPAPSGWAGICAAPLW